MEVVTIIPARGGSRRIPKKNLRLLNGKPLIAYTIEQALAAQRVRRTVVTTDDPEIAKVAVSFGAEVITRPVEIATDTATSESALLHALDHLQATDGYVPELVVFLQCTSPIRNPEDIDQAIETLLQEGADSLLSAHPTRLFVWEEREGSLRSLTFDYSDRRREQDMPRHYRENGSIFVFRPWVLRELNNRLGGKIVVYEMDYWASFDINEEEDFQLCEWLLTQGPRHFRRAKRLPDVLAMVVFDFDGVFTDNRVLVHQDGAEAVLCDRGDGLRLPEVRARGIHLLVLSAETNPVVQSRCRKLQVECVQGVRDKSTTLMEILRERKIAASAVAFVANDINDLACVRAVGCGIAVADAHPEVKAAAHIVLSRRGGDGAVREVCDLILAR